MCIQNSLPPLMWLHCTPLVGVSLLTRERETLRYRTCQLLAACSNRVYTASGGEKPVENLSVCETVYTCKSIK